MELEITLNGKKIRAEAEPQVRLIDLLREEFGIISVKEGCGEGKCGMCTVLIDGKPVTACSVIAARLSGCVIETVEGLNVQNGPGPVQLAFLECGAVQCGFCTPAMILTAEALLRENAAPDKEEIRKAFAGNYCRCTGYVKIIDAIQKASIYKKLLGLDGEFERVREKILKGQRPEQISKVCGTALFAADFTIPGMLYGGVFRSNVPHAYVKKLDVSTAQKVPGIICILDHTAIPGKNRFGIILKDEPCLVDDKVRRFGDAIAVVAGETKEAVEQALKKIRVEYEEIEPVLSFEEAVHEGASLIHGQTNIHAKKHLEHGDVDEAFRKCDVIVERDMVTQRNSHMYAEPDAGLAYYDENGILTVIASTQNPHYDRSEIAGLLGIPQNQVRVKQAVTGGGFGGKLDIGVQLHCALLAWYTKKPVKMVRSRKESTAVSSKRHGIVMHAKTGADKNGKILATEVTIKGDTGAYASYGPAVIGRMPVHAAGPYEVPNVRVDAEFVYTNNPMCGAFRGFGVPQIALLHEGQMDAIARELHMDPIEIRMKNAHRIGSVLPTGQILQNSVGMQSVLLAVKEKAESLQDPDPAVPEKESTGIHIRKGRGIGCMFYGVGNTGLPNPAAAFVEVLSDATAIVHVGAADIGQGSNTVCARIAAQTLGLEECDIHVISADTDASPEGGATSASRQTFVTGNAVRNACMLARKELERTAAEYLNCESSELVFQHRRIIRRRRKDSEVTGDAGEMSYAELMNEMKYLGRLAVGSGYYNPRTTYLNPDTMEGIPFEVYAYAATIADVEVDTETGKIVVKRIISAHDVGKGINPQGIEGQIEGGALMGLGYTLLEEIHVDPKSGKIVNSAMSQYTLPGIGEMPEIYPIIIEDEDPDTMPKGVGEPALIPMIPAIRCAVEQALQVKLEETPLTAGRILKALKTKEQREGREDRS